MQFCAILHELCDRMHHHVISEDLLIAKLPTITSYPFTLKLNENPSSWRTFYILNSGLEIMAGQRTMSGLIGGLTGQMFALPVMLIGHI